MDDSKTRRKVIVARNIKLARALADVSQRQLALRLDMEQRHLSDWENAVHRPMEPALARLGDELEQEPDWFLLPHEVLWDQFGV